MEGKDDKNLSQIETKRSNGILTMCRNAGREYEDEWFGVRQPLNEQGVNELRYVIKTLGCTFSTGEKTENRYETEFGTYEQHFQIRIPRQYFGNGFLNRIANHLVSIPDEMEVFVWDSKRNGKIALIRTISGNPNFYTQKLKDAIIHSYLI